MRAAWAGSALFLLMTTHTVSAAQTPVEVRRGGDDGLAIRFSESVENSFRASKFFVLSKGKTPSSLIATIPINLRWKMIEQRVQFDYAVEFSTLSSKGLGTSKGVCWEDKMSSCADHVIADALRFTRH
jgi:hypothetical protein